MATYDASGIIYARVNTNNTSIALSPDGYLNNQAIVDEIDTPTIASGEFGSMATVGGVSQITGTNTPSFDTEFSIGDYVYYIDGTGNPVLVGQVASFVVGFESSKMDLTALASSNPATAGNPLLAYSNHLITPSESVYIRIPTYENSLTSRQIPNFAVWRQSNNLNVASVSKLDQYSGIGTPLTINTPTPTPVSFTITVMNIFQPTTIGGNTYWNSPADFPLYIWAKLTPVSSATTALNAQTMYRWSTQELLEAVTITSNFPQSQLVLAGYSF